MATEILNKDLYAILDITDEASDKELLKAYRKKALKCHPDKNPDNPRAAEQFHELSRALEILTDPAARAVYDQSRKAKKAAKERTRVLDNKRKKFKEDLEAREQAAFEQSNRANTAEAERKLQAEITRLRKEGSRLLEQEQERLREELKKQRVDDAVKSDQCEELPRIKLKWQAKKGDPVNGGYNTQNLTDILSCYGQLGALIISSKRNGSAIVEFSASITADILDETGLSENPFTMTWLSGKPSVDQVRNDPEESFSFPNHPDVGRTEQFTGSSVNFGASSDVFSTPFQNSGQNFAQCGEESKDFESLVLRKMRQAEERKRLIEEMTKEDND